MPLKGPEEATIPGAGGALDCGFIAPDVRVYLAALSHRRAAESQFPVGNFWRAGGKTVATISDISIMLFPWGNEKPSVGEIVDAARLAEELGFYSVTLPMHVTMPPS